MRVGLWGSVSGNVSRSCRGDRRGRKGHSSQYLASEGIVCPRPEECGLELHSAEGERAKGV